MIKRLNYSFQGTFLAGVASFVLAFISRIKQPLSFVILKVDGRNSCTLRWKLQQPSCRSEKANTRRHWYHRHALLHQDRDVREKTPCLSSHRMKGQLRLWPGHLMPAASSSRLKLQRAVVHVPRAAVLRERHLTPLHPQSPSPASITCFLVLSQQTFSLSQFFPCRVSRGNKSYLIEPS